MLDFQLHFRGVFNPATSPDYSDGPDFQKVQLFNY